jgi:hypothetical protein
VKKDELSKKKCNFVMYAYIKTWAWASYTVYCIHRKPSILSTVSIGCSVSIIYHLHYLPSWRQAEVWRICYMLC